MISRRQFTDPHLPRIRVGALLLQRALLLVPVLLLIAAGCNIGGPAASTRAGQTAEAPAPPHPLAAHFSAALTALRGMNDSGQTGDFQTAAAHFQAFQESYGHVAAAIAEQDAKLRIHIDQGVAELIFEFRKEKPRAFELDEENMKLSQLLEKGASLLGLSVPPELVRRRTVQELPFKTARTVDVTVSDYAVTPAHIEVDRDTKLTLRIQNAGQHLHELAIDRLAVEVEDIQPGDVAELTFVTLDPGEFELACFLPGHYEAGMKGTLVIR